LTCELALELAPSSSEIYHISNMMFLKGGVAGGRMVTCHANTRTQGLSSIANGIKSLFGKPDMM